MPDIMDSASDLVAHFEDSPWWRVSREMNGPDLRDRFNRTIQPMLDTNKDGYLDLEEIRSGLNTNLNLFPDKRDADAVRLLSDYYSFFLDFRSADAPQYYMALHGETLGRYAEFDKIMKRTNQQVADVTSYVTANFKSFDKNNDCTISESELKAKITNGSDKERECAEFLLRDFWSIKSFSPCRDAPTSGIGLLGLAELKSRRTASSPYVERISSKLINTALPSIIERVSRISTASVETRSDDTVPAHLPLNVDLEDPASFPKVEPVERRNPYRYRHHVEKFGEPRVVAPRISPFETQAQAEMRVDEKTKRKRSYNR